MFRVPGTYQGTTKREKKGGKKKEKEKELGSATKRLDYSRANDGFGCTWNLQTDLVVLNLGLCWVQWLVASSLAQILHTYILLILLLVRYFSCGAQITRLLTLEVLGWSPLKKIILVVMIQKRDSGLDQLLKRILLLNPKYNT